MWNPLEWLQLAYEAAGHKHPLASAIITVICFATLGLAVWWRVDSLYRKTHPTLLSSNSSVVPIGTNTKPADPTTINPTGAPMDTLELSSPDDLRIKISNGPDSSGKTYGLILVCINDRPEPVDGLKVAIENAVSFDARRSRFRTNDSYQRIQIGGYTKTPAGDIAKQGFNQTTAWLVRIVSSHLEAGASVAKNSLQWPGGDPSTKEIWLVTLSVEAQGLPTWKPKIRMEWERESNTIRLSAE